jgi:Fe-S cluster biogenesis protein NfuA/nitrite reductase/ring-hydroxylating ferredoxin subunit
MRTEDESPSHQERAASRDPGVRTRSDVRGLQLRVLPAEARVISQEAVSQEAVSQEAVSLDLLLRDIGALEGIIATWEERQRNTVSALERAIDALHKSALTRLIRSLKTSPGAVAALKQAATDPVVYAVLRHHELVRASLQERVEAALESVRPSLASHGGNVELVDIPSPDRVVIRLLGACDGCSAAGLTLSAGVEKAIREHCPEVQHVESARNGLGSRPSRGHYTSPFAHSEEAGWVRAAALDEVPEENILPVVVGQHSLLLSRSGSKLSCFDNACAHLGMPLDGGTVTDGVLTCPHHHFQFSIESGECLTVPEVQLLSHAVRLRGPDVEVKLS